MADLMKIALIGGGAFLVYELFLKPATAAASSSGTPTPTGTPPTGSATPTTPVTVTTPPPAADPMKGQTLDGIYGKLGAAAGNGFMGTVDDWNWYLMQAVPGYVAPDPMPLFSPINFNPPWTRSTKIALGAYWAVMAPYLAQHNGLSGYGPRGLGWMHALSGVR